MSQALLLGAAFDDNLPDREAIANAKVLAADVGSEKSLTKATELKVLSRS